MYPRHFTALPRLSLTRRLPATHSGPTAKHTMHTGYHALTGAAAKIPIPNPSPTISYSPVVLPFPNRRVWLWRCGCVCVYAFDGRRR